MLKFVVEKLHDAILNNKESNDGDGVESIMNHTQHIVELLSQIRLITQIYPHYNTIIKQ